MASSGWWEASCVRADGPMRRQCFLVCFSGAARRFRPMRSYHSHIDHSSRWTFHDDPISGEAASCCFPTPEVLEAQLQPVTHSRVVALVALLITPIVATTPAQTLDQSNQGASVPFSYADYWVGQTFRPAASNSVGAGYSLNTARGQAQNGTIFAQLWSDIPSNPGAVFLAGGSTPYSLVAYTSSFFDVFWPTVSVTPGNTYFLAFQAGTRVTNALQSEITNGDAYLNGSIWYNDATSVNSPWTDYGSYQSPGRDLSFREYSSDVVATPEPAAVLLLATGLAGMLGVSHRRRSRAA